MASTWAVTSALSLALVASLGVLPAPAGTAAFPAALYAGLGVAGLLAWAYALVAAAHGAKGSLVALVALPLAAALLGFFAFRACGNVGTSCGDSPLRIFAGAQIVVGPPAAFAAFAELRRRRGPIGWGDATMLALPMMLFVAWGYVTLTPGAR